LAITPARTYASPFSRPPQNLARSRVPHPFASTPRFISHRKFKPGTRLVVFSLPRTSFPYSLAPPLIRLHALFSVGEVHYPTFCVVALLLVPLGLPQFSVVFFFSDFEKTNSSQCSVFARLQHTISIPVPPAPCPRFYDFCVPQLVLLHFFEVLIFSTTNGAVPLTPAYLHSFCSYLFSFLCFNASRVIFSFFLQSPLSHPCPNF